MRRPIGLFNPAGVVPVAAFFVLYVAVDRLMRNLARYTAGDPPGWSLTVASVDRHVVWWIVIIAVLGVTLGLRSDIRLRIGGPWTDLDHGTVLRLVAAPLIVLLAWEGALYPYNFHLDQLHLLDRILVVTLAAAALWRPLFLIPFALQFRLVSAQTALPFHTTAAENINELPAIALLLIGVGHLLFALTGRRSSSVVVLAIGALLASHFWIPGKGKLLMGWLPADDPANLPLAAYTAGWLGHTDGSVASTLASAFDRFGPMVKAATLVLELGSLVAVAHRRLLRPWLVGWITFHIVTFITTGFFFIGWVLVEVGLLIILTRRDLRAWVDENATWPRAVAAIAAVAAAPVLFHPPGLAWIDAPVSYGYRLRAVGESGNRYEITASTFAPLEHEILFKRLQFDGPSHLSGGYGALASTERLDELNRVDDVSDLVALEAAQPAPDADVRAVTVEVLTAFMDATADGGRRTTTRWLHRVNPPPLFWSSWPDDEYHFDERLDRLDVVLLTRIHNSDRRADGTTLTRDETVAVLSRLPDGSLEVEMVRR